MEIKKFTFKWNQDFLLPEGWMPFQVDDIPETGRIYVWAYRPIIRDFQEKEKLHFAMA